VPLNLSKRIKETRTIRVFFVRLPGLLASWLRPALLWLLRLLALWLLFDIFTICTTQALHKSFMLRYDWRHSLHQSHDVNRNLLFLCLVGSQRSRYLAVSPLCVLPGYVDIVLRRVGTPIARG
jgi:hypothetical protein